MQERITVIGSNSFSGSHFVDHVLGQGAAVQGISRSPEPSDVFLPYRKRQAAAFDFRQLDLNNDLDEIMECIRGFAPSYVVNFAAQSMVAQSWENPEHWFMTNTVSTVKLHDRLRRCEFLKKYVHISTPEVYGTRSGLVKERTDYCPSTPYAVSRAAADMSLMSFRQAYGFPVVFTRAANVYGPGQQLYRIIPRTILCCLTGRKLQLHGGGLSVRSFVHIRDVAGGTMRVAKEGTPGEIYHLATAEHISIRALVETIASKLGVSFEDHVEVSKERLGKDSAYLLDTTKARDSLGWQARIGLNDGVEETIKWVKTNLDELKKESWEYVHKP